MCGIAGSVGVVSKKFNHEELARALGHRGPDAQGLVRLPLGNKEAIIAHTRLSIVDLSEAGSQPMYSHDGRWIITYNGEIYNHLDLRKTLSVSFRGHSDTETIVECISAWGFDAAISKLNGIFGIAACDLHTNTLHIARDPFGVKPIYYYEDLNGLSFASEVRAIKAVSGLNFALDYDALESFLALRFTPSPQTLFNGIRRLGPGSTIEYDCNTGNLKEKKYICSSSKKFLGNRYDARDEYQRILSGAVKRQLLSDVPLGIFLSGGVDSALIAALAQEEGADLTAFTVGFGANYRECEITQAKHTADVLGMRHEATVVDHDSCWDAIVPAISHIEEPLGTTSILPMWHLSKMAGASYKAVLTGQGTDEPWGGYKRYQGALINQFLPKSKAWNLFLPLVSNNDPLDRAIRSCAAQDEASGFMEMYSLFTSEERTEMLADKNCFDASQGLRGWLHWVDPNRSLSSVERMMAIDCRMNLSDDLLLYGDKISMAHSLEARVPMLDLEVINFIQSLPRSFKISLNQSKIVHKLMAQRYLPSEIVNRQKLGFQVPVGDWIKGPWKDRTIELLLHNAKLQSVLNVDLVAKILNEHLHGYRDRQRQIFALIGLAHWVNLNL